MLKFIGTGSAFNTELGNTSAYIKEGDSMFLIDCGSSVFKTIKEENLLNDVKHLNVFITHTHADHVGSLADLIFYMYYVKGAVDGLKVNVITGHKVFVGDFLKMNGVIPNIHFKEIKVSSTETFKVPHFRNLFLSDLSLNRHVDELFCFGFDLYYNGFVVYYSGDTSTVHPVIVEKINNGYYDFVFVDTSLNDIDSRVHMHYTKLDTMLGESKYRKVIHCMHLDVSAEENLAVLTELGFNIAKSSFRKEIETLGGLSEQ